MVRFTNSDYSEAARKIAIPYLLLALLWIVLTDTVVHMTAPSQLQKDIQTYKGIFFVFGSAVFILFIAGRNQSKLNNTIRDLESVRDRFRRAQSVARTGSWEVDLAKEALTWSDEVFSIFGIARSAFGGTEEAFFDLVHPEDRAWLLAARSSWLERGGVLDAEHRIIRSDGEIAWVRELAEVIAGPDGQPAYTTGTVSDITERKKEEQRRKEAEDQLQQALENQKSLNAELSRSLEALDRQAHLLEMAGSVARLGGWEADLRADTIFWSDQVCDIHDMPRGTAPSLAEGIDFYAPGYRQRITELFGACAANGTPYDEEFQIVTAAGRRRWVRAAGRAMQDGEGRIVSVIGAFQDISEPKRAEAELALRREQVDRFERTHSAGVTAATIAHEIAQPLGTIRNYANGALRSFQNNRPLDAEETRRLFGVIQEEAERASSTVKRIRNLLNTGASSAETANIGDLIARVIAELAPAASAAEVRIEPSGELDKRVTVDGTALRAALRNLLRNAIQATAGLTEERRLITVTVSVGQGHIQIMVSDRGSGIAPGQVEEVFEPFVSTKSDGLGLGLAITRRLIEENGGDISVESEPDRGTTFTISLPVPA